MYGQITTDAGLNFTLEDFNLFDDADAWCEATLGTVRERHSLATRRAARAQSGQTKSLLTTDLGAIIIVEVKRRT